MATKSEANFRISIDGNAADQTKDVASSARLAAKAIGAYEEEIKTLSGDLRRLRGNSDEVNAAKKVLKDRIDKARASVSSLTAELNKQGTSYAAAAAAAKKYGTSMRASEALKGAAGKLGELGKGAGKAIGAALGKAAGPLGKKIGAAIKPAAAKVGEFVAPAGKAIGRFGKGAGKVLGKVGSVARDVGAKALPSMGSALSAVAAVGVTATAAIAAVAVAAVAAAAAAIGLGISSADAAQKMNRQRQALLGNADDAKRLGDQITALAGKVPQGVEELNALGVELSKTRLPGKALVDTMNAVAQASGAVDASAGAKLQEIITRTANTGRMGIGLQELQGTGLEFDDVAKAYAEGTKKSIEAARQELMSGMAPVTEGAEAIRKATERKFGKLNMANAFSLENAPKKFFDQMKSLTAGVNFEPLQKALMAAFGQLSPDAPLGRAVKTFFEGFGTDLVAIAARAIPAILEGFKWMMVGALRVATFFYEMKKKIQDAFSVEGWIGVGKAVVEGLVKGIKGYYSFAAEAASSLAGTIKDAFTGKLKIESPSKVFEQYGKYTTEGYAQGVKGGTQKAADAVAAMAPMPDAGGGKSAASAPVGDIHLHFHGAQTGSAAEMQSPALLAAITRAVRDAQSARAVAA